MEDWRITLADVTAALKRSHGLVRWMAMRRDVFAVRVQDAPLLHAAVGASVGDMLHRRLISRLSAVRRRARLFLVTSPLRSVRLE